MCYKIYTTTKKANNARTFCESISGHLVRIDTKVRFDVITGDPSFGKFNIPIK